MEQERGQAAGKGAILVVDDEPYDQSALRRLLERHGHRVLTAEAGKTALALADAHLPDLVLLDVKLVGMDGFTVCRKLKAEAATRDIPVIFISGADDLAAKVKAFDSGGVDYITKPFHNEEVLARVATHLTLYGLQRRLEDIVRQRSSVLALANSRLQREIAERRQAEERFRGILEAAPDAMVMIDERRGIVLVNSRAEALFGYAREELLGQPVEMLMPERFQGQHATWSSGYIAMPKPRAMGEDLTLFGRRRDGSEFPLEISLSPLHTADGVAVISAIRDVTARRQAEAALREREARIRRLVDANIIGIIFWRFDGAITEANDAFLRMVGCSREDLAAGCIRWDRMTPPEYEEITARAMAEVRSGGVCTPYEKEYLRAAGGRVPVLVGNALLTDSPDDGVSFVLDLSGTKAVERELLESRQRLRELATHGEMVREEERKRIAGEIHDELGALLTALKMDLSLLRREVGGNGAALERLGQMRELVERTIHMVRQVATRLRPAALNLGLVAALEWLAEDFERHCGVSCGLAASAEVDMDDAQATAVFRIVQESLTNVARHAGASHVEVSLKRQSEGIELAVEDDGCGFDPATVGSASFGLFGMRERARMLGGRAQVCSAPGGGTRVAIWIPLPDAGPARAEAK